MIRVGVLVRCTQYGNTFLCRSVDELIGPSKRPNCLRAQRGDIALVIDYNDICETHGWDKNLGELGNPERNTEVIYVLGPNGAGWTWKHEWELL